MTRYGKCYGCPHLDDASDVSVPLGIVYGPECRFALAVVCVTLEDRARTLPLCADHSTHRAEPPVTMAGRCSVLCCCQT